MKFYILAMITVLSFPLSSYAAGLTHFELTVINGGHMPISPAAIYVQSGAASSADVGLSPSAGFIQLCQTGSPAGRVPELKAEKQITFLTQTTAPILPGESRTIDVAVEYPWIESLHFEGMYGKTKDTCSVGLIDSTVIAALMNHRLREFVGRDSVLQTGSFTDPTLPSQNGAADANVCKGLTDAVSCLRSLALATQGTATIRFFAPYFPSVVSFLESKYGTSDTETLIIPTSGAVQFRLKLK